MTTDDDRLSVFEEWANRHTLNGPTEENHDLWQSLPQETREWYADHLSTRPVHAPTADIPRYQWEEEEADNLYAGYEHAADNPGHYRPAPSDRIPAPVQSSGSAGFRIGVLLLGVALIAGIIYLSTIGAI